MTVPPMTNQPPPPKPRRRVRPLPIVIMIVIVLACLLVAGDRVGERIAEDQVGDQLQAKLRTPDSPQVEILQIPFLTQLVTRRFGEVTLAAEQIPVNTSSPAALDRLDLVLRDVTYADEQLTAGTVDGTAFLDYESLSTIGGAEVRYLDDGKITIDFTTPVGGQTVSGTLTGRPVLADGELSLVEPQLRLGGVDLPQTLVDALLTTLLQSFSLPDLPLDLALTAVTASESGFTFGLAARDLSLASN